jgi:hypothetical protein
LLDLANLIEQEFALVSSLRDQINRGDRALLCQRASADDGDSDSDSDSAEVRPVQVAA